MIKNEQRALIITTAGIPLCFDDAYDKTKHWRYALPERKYDLLVVAYGDYWPEPGTYDFVIKRSGLKWHLISDVTKMFDWTRYDYIGCYDDDYATDIPSINLALDLARQHDFRYFQQSIISWTAYEPIKQNPAWVFSETNFTETGVPIFRNDMFQKYLRFLDDYRYEKSCWGIDKILSHYLNTPANIVHACSIKHMRPDVSSYSKDDGFKAMDYLMKDFYPKYMKEHFNRDYQYCDEQVTFRAWAK